MGTRFCGGKHNKMILKVVIISLLSLTASSAYVSYENYKVYEAVPETVEQVKLLTELQEDPHYDFWSDVIKIGKDVRIMVPPDYTDNLVNGLRKVQMEPVLLISNVQQLIREQMQPAGRASRTNSLGSMNWNQYFPLQEIHAWLDELQDLYPDIVKTVTVGKSNEGRDIKGVIIDFKNGTRGPNPLIAMIEGGIHAREWISPATVTGIIKEFLTSNDNDVKHLAETFIWHIFPVINPDGYVYTFSNDRMWRKNRNPANYKNCSITNDRSNGIDLNRNFNYLWMTIGASSDACDQTYAGPYAASEPETVAISNYVLGLKTSGNLLYYFAFHSYSQMTLVPFSHVSGQQVLQVSNYADLFEIAARGAEKLSQQHGTVYEVGTSADILYPVSGSSFDWVKGVAEVPIVYLFELRDVGKYGFLLPSQQIVKNNEEMLACLVEMDKTAMRLGYYHSAASKGYVSLISLMISTFLLIIIQ